jgi:tRNA uridine 5-carboxymethylaminomethyl modification enzyme
MNNYDCIVIGGGHAGIEAALASVKMGLKALLLTMDIDAIGRMSCNPAIGGVGKGQLVKEIDALGGMMAKAADACGIQFRILNLSRGAAVQSSRAQIDMDLYNRHMKELILNTAGLEVKAGEIKKLLIDNGQVEGVVTENGDEIRGKTVIICAGTFLDGLIHVGLRHFEGGRINETAAIGLGDDLKKAGLNILRFKTGTCPRLDSTTIDYSNLIIQNGDNPPRPFSFSTEELSLKQVPCHITYTNKNTHKIITDNLDRSPLYSGKIKATGVRYCPSIEDKIVKFSDKERHQIFLEPQGLNTAEVYPNGISTSLPEDVQLDLIHSIPGLEGAKVIRFGYGIEYLVVEPTQLYPSLEAKTIRNLYFAGQINGTTGYEEAAAQGLIAGINAALRVKKEEPFILDRSSSYIGVLIDDLTTKGTNEPYRMFTSRVEYRLILREDNADLRLSQVGYKLGLATKESWQKALDKVAAIKRGVELLKKTHIKPQDNINSDLAKLDTAILKKETTLEELLKRPQVSLKDIASFSKIDINLDDFAIAQGIEIEVKYSGFILRQLKDVERFKNLEKIRIPADIDYRSMSSLSWEIKEKLSSFKPVNLGQASRISGVTPAAITMLMIYLRKANEEELHSA